MPAAPQFPIDTQGHSFAAWLAAQPAAEPQLGQEPRAGNACPNCQVGRLAYDGLLNLACSACGYSLSGGAGCT